ncbi:GNAT family N-acetyltransferase [Bacillus suaedaesalsae]|uniref:GNAT family N-acetyltransferase n=1 Tax=Bacillus suaedaesalsae TaxID=2810349 RepID=A0ABS2DHR4_9BACI|nr:GNAT family N-acetyltransferase [Bacillus suaedaesalsae]MBM6617565.1 GNAT family N-acetyltransferase [Bacillus suaedaesalsae]
MSKYYKELYVFDKHSPKKAIIRNYTSKDFDALIHVQKESFPPPFPSELWWNKDQLSNHVNLFPEGALCVEIDGIICGSITGLQIDYKQGDLHTWDEVTSSGYISNHQTDGNALYIVDICVMPLLRKYGLGKWLMQSMYETVVNLKLDLLLGGGRLPGYHKFSNEMNIDTYVQKILSGEIYDPVITFLLKCGRTPVGVIPNYLEDDESHHYGLLMEWENPFKEAGT